VKGGFLNSGQNGQLMGYRSDLIGHIRWCYFWRKPVYRFTLSRNHPLTYRDDDGKLWQPNKHYEFDWGSVPPFLQGFPNLVHTRYLFYPLHDSCYMEGGLWKVFPESRADNYLDLTTNRRFVKLTRGECDAMLRRSIPNDPCPGSAASAFEVWTAVRAGGAFCKYGVAGDLRRQKVA